MSEELPELPEWVQDLIQRAEERGYDKGYYEGRKQLHWSIQNRIQSVLNSEDPRR